MHNGSEWLHRLKNNARVKEEIKYRVFFSKHIKGTDHKIQDMIYVLDVLDVKAGPLLTFIGLVLTSFTAFIALDGVDLTGKDNMPLVLLTLLVATTLITAAFFALSCVYVIGPHTRLFQKYIRASVALSEEEHSEAVLALFATVAGKRRIRYLIAFYAAFTALFLFFLLLFLASAPWNAI